MVLNLESRLVMPTADEVKEHAWQMYRNRINGFKEDFEDVNRVSIVVDAWVEKNPCPSDRFPEDRWYLVGVTAHWLDIDWILCKRLLTVREVFVHNGDWLSDVVLKALDEYGLKSKVCAVTSNAAQSKSMMKILVEKLKDVNPHFNSDRLVICPNHFINQITKAMLKSLKVLPSPPKPLPSLFDEDSETEEIEDKKDPYVRSSISLEEATERVRIIMDKICGSKKNYKKFLNLCKSFGKPAVEWRDDEDWFDLCPARWSSTFAMLSAAIANREALDKAASSFLNTPSENFTILPEEWAILNDLTDILRPFREVVYFFSQSKRRTASEAIAVVNALTRHLDEVMQSFDKNTIFKDRNLFSAEQFESIKSAFVAIQTKFSEYATLLLRNKTVAAAAVFDPCTKLSVINNEYHAEVLSFIKGLLDESGEEVCDGSSESESDGDPSIPEFVAKAIRFSKSCGGQKPKPTPAQELDKYLDFPNFDDEDPLPFWWREDAGFYFPKLWKIAKEFLSVSITCTPPEQLYDVSHGMGNFKGEELDEELDEENVKMRLTLSNWFKCERGGSDDKDKEVGLEKWVEGEW